MIERVGGAAPLERPAPPGADGDAPSQAPPGALPFRRFLLAVRPGEPNPRLWGVVGDLLRARAHGVVCHVVVRPTTAAANDADGSPANSEEAAINQELRSRLIDRLGTAGRDLPIRILHGDPGERICEYAEFAACDLIVLARRGKPSFGRWARGSVSRRVAATTRRSVLLVGD